MRNKLKLTEELVKQLPNEYSTTLENAKNTWWFNIRPTGGMRLTALGFKVLTEQLDLKFYSYKIPDEMLFTQQTVLDLDRKLQNPYFIVTKKQFPTNLIFFSSKEAMLINLYGDLANFLDNYKP